MRCAISDSAKISQECGVGGTLEELPKIAGIAKESKLGKEAVST